MDDRERVLAEAGHPGPMRRPVLQPGPDPLAQPGNQALARWNYDLPGSTGLDLFHASRAPTPVLRPPVHSIPVAATMPEGYHVIEGLAVCEEINPSAPGFQAHRWLEMYEESYGWWPRDPARRDDPDRAVAQTVGVVLFAVPGELNAQNWGGSPTRDRVHGSPARRWRVIAPPGLEYRDIAPRVREFAGSYRDVYSWNLLGTDCIEFVAKLMTSVGLMRYEEIPGGGKAY